MSLDHRTLNHEYRAIGKKIKLSVELETATAILGTDINELTDYYLQANAVQQLQCDKSRTELAQFKRGTTFQHEKLKPEVLNDLSKIAYEYEQVFIAIPIQPHPQLNIIKSYGPTINEKAAVKWREDKIVFRIDVIGLNFHKSEDELTKEIITTKKEIYQWIEQLNIKITNYNASLKNDIVNWIQVRKEKLLAVKERQDSLLQRINIPLQKKEDETIRRIKLDPKSIIQRVKPTPDLEEYVIDRPKVLDVIYLLDNYGRQLERTPATFANSGEEDLRNIFLVGLNGVFEGKATGETFLNKGKTDIYLNIDKGNILVCECKIWNGKQHYSYTIDQLLGYLTWRNNYGILVTFINNKSLTKALGETKNAIPKHSTYKKGIEKISDTHLISQHRLPTDGLKNVEIHHLFYHLYFEAQS